MSEAPRRRRRVEGQRPVEVQQTVEEQPQFHGMPTNSVRHEMNQPVIMQNREYEPVRYENEREVSRGPVYDNRREVNREPVRYENETPKPRKAPHVEEERTRRKRSILVLISAIIGTLYAIYLISYFSGLGSTAASDTEAAGFGIATILVMPHMALTALAVIFNWLGFFTKVRGLVLTGAILYCVAAFVFFMYAGFVVPEIILSFIGFVRMKKR